MAIKAVRSQPVLLAKSRWRFGEVWEVLVIEPVRGVFRSGKNANQAGRIPSQSCLIASAVPFLTDQIKRQEQSLADLSQRWNNAYLVESSRASERELDHLQVV